MNLRNIINETLVANNGEVSRGIKNQLNILPAIIDEDLEKKVELLKKEKISFYNYNGLRILEFSLENLAKTLEKNSEKKEIYSTNPQELVRDLRAQEIEIIGSSLEPDLIGGMER